MELEPQTAWAENMSERLPYHVLEIHAFKEVFTEIEKTSFQSTRTELSGR